MADIEMKWYVLRAVSGKEAKVKEYIDAEINNGSLGGFVSQVVIPTEKVVKVVGGKRVIKERIAMTGYVFVEAKLVGEIAHTLRNTPNCLGFLGGLDHPDSLSESDVRRILGEGESVEEEITDILIPYSAGENVKVIDGPFSGFNGVIESVNQEKATLVVSVKVFGRPTPLTLGFMQVEKE